MVEEDIVEVKRKGINFKFINTPTAPYLIREIFNDNYKILEKGLQFQPNDIILDIGANEGMFSIMMARLFPFTKIISLEPVQKTFFTMIRNIGLNGVANIYPYKFGVGGRNSKSETIYCDKIYSGGSSMVVTPNFESQDILNVEVVAFDDIFNICKFSEIAEIDRVKLLKMDIEGAEYETLYNSTCLSKVDNMVAEFHINTRLETMGYDINELATWVGSKTRLVCFEKMRMAE